MSRAMASSLRRGSWCLLGPSLVHGGALGPWLGVALPTGSPGLPQAEPVGAAAAQGSPRSQLAPQRGHLDLDHSVGWGWSPALQGVSSIRASTHWCPQQTPVHICDRQSCVQALPRVPGG